MDLIIGGIKERFDQPGYKIYSKLEELITKAANKEEFQEEIKFVTDFYKDDIDPELLNTQLSLLSCNLPPDSSPHHLASILQFLRKLTEAQRTLMSEVCKVAALILVMPATNATSERSFSALRYIKSYLRATMSQTRLNNVMVLYVHREL